MFIPYHSTKGTVDLVAADAKFTAALECAREKMRRITTRWVPSLQFIADLRPEMHWCAYEEGRVVAFLELRRSETFGDMEDIYEFVSSQVRHLKSLGNYNGDFVDRPDHEDEPDITWRKWTFQAGDSKFVLNVGFAMSQFCRIEDDGEELVTVKKRRVVCGDPVSVAA